MKGEKMTKLKLFIGALTAALIIGAPVTVSVHRNAARAIDAPQASEKEQPLAQSAIPEKPVTDTPQLPSTTNDTPATPVAKPTCNQRVDVYCYGVHGRDEYGTPIPEVQVTQPAQPWVRSDGYFNYCYQMTDGSWTTVTGKIELGKGVYYYGGDIDPATEAPAYAVESQQWCASHIPAEAL